MKTDESKEDADGKLKNGLFQEYYSEGELASIGNYKDGGKAGVWKRYHPNGALYDEGAFADNKKAGEWCVYDPTGKLVRTTRHKPPVSTPSPKSRAAPRRGVAR